MKINRSINSGTNCFRNHTQKWENTIVAQIVLITIHKPVRKHDNIMILIEHVSVVLPLLTKYYRPRRSGPLRPETYLDREWRIALKCKLLSASQLRSFPWNSLYWLRLRRASDRSIMSILKKKNRFIRLCTVSLNIAPTAVNVFLLWSRWNREICELCGPKEVLFLFHWASVTEACSSSGYPFSGSTS